MIGVERETKEAIVNEVKQCLNEKKYSTNSQLFADVSIRLRKKGWLSLGKGAKAIGGCDIIRKVWKEYCNRDEYWNNVYTEASKVFKRASLKEIKRLKHQVQKMFENLQSISVDDFLNAMVLTGLSEDVVRDIKTKILARKNKNVKKRSSFENKSDFVNGAKSIENRVSFLEESYVNIIHKLDKIYDEIYQEKQQKEFGEHTNRDEIDWLRKLNSAIVNQIQQEIKSLINVFNVKSVELEESIQAVNNIATMFCERQIDVWRSVIKEINSTSSKEQMHKTPASMPKLSVHKDDTSPFENAGMI